MCKGPVVRGNPVLRLRNDQDLGSEEAVRTGKAEELPGPGSEGPQPSVARSIGHNASVGPERNLAGHSQHCGEIQRERSGKCSCVSHVSSMWFPETRISRVIKACPAPLHKTCFSQ